MAPQKELAKQRASTELLILISGIPHSSILPDGQDAERLQEDALSNAQETHVSGAPASENYKGRLYELAQVRQWDRPTFSELERSGPSHAPTFTVRGEIVVEGQTFVAEGSGASKTLAEQQAAEGLLVLVPHPIVRRDLLFPTTPTNAVSVLNELVQRKELRNVTYHYTSSGVPHVPIFVCTCTITTGEGKVLEAVTIGSNKKEGAQGAALQGLQAYAMQRPETLEE